MVGSVTVRYVVAGSVMVGSVVLGSVMVGSVMVGSVVVNILVFCIVFVFCFVCFRYVSCDQCCTCLQIVHSVFSHVYLFPSTPFNRVQCTGYIVCEFVFVLNIAI